MKKNIKWFIFLHIIIAIFSTSGICSKLASGYDPLTKNWIFFYGIVICILGFYAIAWQQVLKHLPLIATYANKAVTTIWGMIWGATLFAEKITVQRVIGALIVIVGVYLVVAGDEENIEKTQNEEGNENA